MACVTMFALGVVAGYLLRCFMEGAAEVGGVCGEGGAAPYKTEGCGGDCKCNKTKETANAG